MNVSVGGRNGTPMEQVAKPESFWYAESGRSGWVTTGIDIQSTLGGFDVDDRGYLYVGTRAFGWGIGKDNGSGHVEFVYQDTTATIVGEQVISLKFGNTYHVVISDGRAGLVYDVTDPAHPRQLAFRQTKQFGILASTKHDASSRFAWIAADGLLDISAYSTAASASVNESLRPDAGKKWKDVGYDDAGTLWAVDSGTSARPFLYNVTAARSHDVLGDAFTPEKMAVGAGLIAVSGTGPARPSTTGFPLDIRLFAISATATPIEIPTKQFFRDFYFAPPVGNAKPGPYIGLKDMRIVAHDGKRYLLLSAFGIGDVFEIEGAIATVPQTPPVTQPPAQKTCPTCGGSGKVNA